MLVIRVASHALHSFSCLLPFIIISIHHWYQKETLPPAPMNYFSLLTHSFPYYFLQINFCLSSFWRLLFLSNFWIAFFYLNLSYQEILVYVFWILTWISWRWTRNSSTVVKYIEHVVERPWRNTHMSRNHCLGI